MQTTFQSIIGRHNVSYQAANYDKLYNTWSVNYKEADDHNKRQKNFKLTSTGKFALMSNTVFRAAVGIDKQRVAWLKHHPTTAPVKSPTFAPSSSPSTITTQQPTKKPTARPSSKETVKPSVKPTTKSVARSLLGFYLFNMFLFYVYFVFCRH